MQKDKRTQNLQQAQNEKAIQMQKLKEERE